MSAFNKDSIATVAWKNTEQSSETKAQTCLFSQPKSYKTMVERTLGIWNGPGGVKGSQGLEWSGA